ncbi:dihydrodipicolinate synthase family protein [Parapedobacter soli]|uniref:dihydrodipicolinate synthase family protein n=1 Tax=Parapedobacter soli TaxID=416955 RepID=UPI0021C606EF|nr:dihydrodipicolinate synthase family protein [Parapedobacter soli]
MKEGFEGLWPALFTPVKSDGTPNYEELHKLVELLISQGLDGLYILGSSGQGVLFTEQQRKEIAKNVCDQVRGRIPVMVQVGALTTAESIRLARDAEHHGASGISSVGPIYYASSAEMALEHYRSIAQATSLPFFPYQLGKNSIPGDITSFIGQLVEIPNVAGMKLTTTELLEISVIHNYAGDRLKLFSGADELICHASLCGTVGAIGSTYNLWGAQCKFALQEFKNGNYNFARDFMLAFQETIFTILPDVWTFLRSAMLLKHQIDIGPTVAPLGNANKVWKPEDVISITDRIDALVSAELPH